MALEIKKKERESVQGLIRRFTKSMQRSGILIRARKSRFKQRTKSKKMKRKSALRKEEKRKEYEKLRKLGKLQERYK